jgi:predicted N-acyltransferase
MPGDEVRIFPSLNEIGRERWDALLSPHSTPFMRFAWLSAMETSGCAAPRAGWAPRHLTVWRKGQLVAAAPAWAKDDSDGDFARDWDLASASSGARLRYYPKLALTVPFTPCTGERILVAPGEDRAKTTDLIVRAARQLCADEQYATFQTLFPDAPGAGELENAGLAYCAAGFQSRPR